MDSPGLWISMDYTGLALARISMDQYGFSWIRMDYNGLAWISMSWYGLAEISLNGL